MGKAGGKALLTPQLGDSTEVDPAVAVRVMVVAATLH